MKKSRLHGAISFCLKSVPVRRGTAAARAALYARVMKFSAALSLATVAFVGCRQPTPPPDANDDDSICVAADGAAAVDNVGAAAAEADIAAVVDAGRVAAAGVGVAVSTRPVWLHAAGDRDPDAGVAATVDTPFMLASVTKTVVATAILQLVERGELDLDVDVGEQAPVFAGVRNPAFPDVAITPRMLLTHTSSLYDVLFTFDATWATAGDSPVPMRDFVAGYFDDGSASFGGADMWWPSAPGTFSCYSNMGVAVLGVLAEEVSGLSLEELTHERIFRPLGMQHTSFRADAFCDGALARGVRAEDGGFVDDNLGAGPQPEGHAELASGMLKSSPRDLLAFATAIANGGVSGEGARILDEATVELMLTRQLDAALDTCGDGRSDPAQQALGFTHFPDANGNDWVGHYGGMNGASSSMWFLRESASTDAIAYVALINVADVGALVDVEGDVVQAVQALTGR